MTYHKIGLWVLLIISGHRVSVTSVETHMFESSLYLSHSIIILDVILIQASVIVILVMQKQFIIEFQIECMSNLRNTIHKLMCIYILPIPIFTMRLHSSEKIGLRSIKMSSQMLLSNFTFPLMNALVYVNIYQGPGHS